MNCYYVLLVVWLVSLVKGQVTSPGKCALFDSKGKFSIEQFFAGTWYVVEGYPNRYHTESICQELTMSSNGKYVYINETVFDARIDQYQTIPGAGKFSKKGNMNHLVMTPGLKSLPKNSHLWVVATDYNNYGLVYVCDQLISKDPKSEDQKREYMYLLSRYPSMRPGLRARIIIDNIVRGGFQVAPLGPMNQIDCPVVTDYPETQKATIY